MDFDAQKTADAVGEAQRFLQLMHGMDWMTQLAQTAVDAQKIVQERQAQADVITAQCEKYKADFKDSYGKLTADLNAQIDALQSQLGALEGQHSAKAEEYAALLASSDKAKADLSAELSQIKAGAAAVLASLNAEADAKAKERDALQAAIDDMHAKVAGLK